MPLSLVHPLFSLEVRHEEEAFAARRLAREVAAALRFGDQGRMRVAAAVSELVRTFSGFEDRVLQSGQKRGAPERPFLPLRLSFGFADDVRTCLQVRASSKAPLDEARLRADSGFARVEKLVGHCRMGAGSGDGTIDEGSWCAFELALSAEAAAELRADPHAVRERLSSLGAVDPFEELLRQNQELAAALGDLERNQRELEQLNAELQDTNRGVLALYTELDEKASSFQRASEDKTRFLSDMSHEFRTPVNSALSLTRLLLDEDHGTLTDDQTRNVQFIRRSMQDLSTLVNDLLDLAKAEAGKLTVRPAWFTVPDLLGALRGMFRPLLAELGTEVVLFVEEPVDFPLLHNDEGKLSQILRNFVSNAIKFTERGSIRVEVERCPLEQGDALTFRVIDTGIGIPAEHLVEVFEEFRQIEGSLQQRFKGTGLGLPLARKLAQVLGGSVGVESRVGKGSTFSVTLPRVLFDTANSAQRASVESGSFPPVVTIGTAATEAKEKDAGDTRGGAPMGARTALIVDDCDLSRYLLRDLLQQEGYDVHEAACGEEGLRAVASSRPDVLFLDLSMPDVDGYEVLARLRSDESTRSLPVIIHSSGAQEEREGWLRAHALALVSKQHHTRESARREVAGALARAFPDMNKDPTFAREVESVETSDAAARKDSHA